MKKKKFNRGEIPVKKVKKPYKIIMWGFKCKTTGIILTGHNYIPIMNHTRKETERGIGRDWKAAKIIIQEA